MKEGEPVAGAMPTRFGYACINQTLASQKPRVSCNRGMIKRTWEARGLPHASKTMLANVTDLLEIVRWNNQHGIQVFRITSQLAPWATEYELTDLPDWPSVSELLRQIGEEARNADQRLSFHPGQFNVLASPHEHVVQNTIRDLRTHGDLMDAMGMPRTPEAKINLHVGGAYGERDRALERFCRAYEHLPDSVATRLTVENDDRASLFSVRMLHDGVHRRIGIPIVFDSHHWELGPQDQPYDEALDMAVSTWGDIRPTCHHSNSRRLEDEKAKASAHSEWFYTPFRDRGHSVDCVLECKQKELALIRYLRDFISKEDSCSTSSHPHPLPKTGSSSSVPATMS